MKYICEKFTFENVTFNDGFYTVEISNNTYLSYKEIPGFETLRSTYIIKFKIPNDYFVISRFYSDFYFENEEIRFEKDYIFYKDDEIYVNTFSNLVNKIIEKICLCESGSENADDYHLKFPNLKSQYKILVIMFEKDISVILQFLHNITLKNIYSTNEDILKIANNFLYYSFVQSKKYLFEKYSNRLSLVSNCKNLDMFKGNDNLYLGQYTNNSQMELPFYQVMKNYNDNFSKGIKKLRKQVRHFLENSDERIFIVIESEICFETNYVINIEGSEYEGGDFLSFKREDVEISETNSHTTPCLFFNYDVKLFEYSVLLFYYDGDLKLEAFDNDDYVLNIFLEFYKNHQLEDIEDIEDMIAEEYSLKEMMESLFDDFSRPITVKIDEKIANYILDLN